MKKLLIVPALLMLGACSKGDAIVFDDTVGPATHAEIEKLPKNLEGDHANAKYSDAPAVAPDMTTDDGTPAKGKGGN
ncbi:hypothetical protein [Kordiimonas marina]|uniref:hypothetical protein n=1 Tax=Kordiimonas marina TaxID=2872312 RepID=UPI001FF5A4CB|nr:hypothetical protein [Kordiimonas marina]MCJ9429489.1 hypothetical protein [Kordiimonas marina]